MIFFVTVLEYLCYMIDYYDKKRNHLHTQMVSLYFNGLIS